MKLKENDHIPNSEIYVLENGEPIKKNFKDVLKNKKAIIFGLPGAYTSVCSAKRLPSYVNMHQQYKDKGIDHIICMSVNDPFVMSAWGADRGVGENVMMLSDGNCEFTSAIGLEMDGSGFGLGTRSQRYAMVIDNGVVSALNVEAGPGLDVSSAESILELI